MSWKAVQAKKAEMRTKAVSSLSGEEQEILMKVLAMEWENRHLKTPDVRRPLRSFVKQVIQ